MTAILYPVATSGEAALAAPAGRAARAREAQAIAGQAVDFVTEAVGPSFATREAALDAWAGRLEDERPGHAASLPSEDRYCVLMETALARPPAPVRPAYRDGRRWPEPPAAPKTVWRLQVSYWRPQSAERELEAPQARQARRGVGEGMAGEMLRALTRQPLRPVEPQRPLDIGLFETRLPERPDVVVPDE
ncbi:hypothetical protein [Phenylobacterium sp.]|uniref:hypothetical protein n=1 Tax=Phenylobacterium sp. TaxID=1871053 RepID=UPI0035AF74D8